MYLEHARKIKPEISPQAGSMISQYYINLKKSNQNFKSKRALETLLRLSKMVAKLRLKDVVDSDEVMHATKFYNILVNSYLSSVAVIPQDPEIRSVERCRTILEEKGTPTLFSEIVKQACYDDEYIRSYITGSQAGKIEESQMTPEKNKKIRKIRNLLLKDENILVITKTPLKIAYKQVSLNKDLTAPPMPNTSEWSERSDSLQ